MLITVMEFGPCQQIRRDALKRDGSVAWFELSTFNGKKKEKKENEKSQLPQKYNGIEIKTNTNKTIEQQLQIEKWT